MPLSITLRVLSVAALLTLSLPASAQDIVAQEEEAFKNAATLASLSIVQVQTVGGIDVVGEVLTGTGPTTGVVISEDGFILSSAFNFASKPSAILVQLPDARRFNAKLVATDHSRMLTLLKIDAEDLTPIKTVTDEDIKVGHWSLALGRTYSNAFPSVSVGIVSAKERIFGRALQTDAKVSPVNYGGPLVNVKGEAMGILVPLSQQGGNEVAGVQWYDSGIGFAIPMDDILQRLDTMKAGTDLHPGLMGVAFKDRDQLAGNTEVALVRPASPAADAGIEKGDVITKVDGSDVVRQMEIKQALGSRYAGDEIEVVVKRGDETKTLSVTLAKSLDAYKRPFLGILASDPEGDEEAGVRVRDVMPETAADAGGLQKRDVVTKVGEDVIADRESLMDAISLQKAGAKVTLTVERPGEGDASETKTLEVTLGEFPDDPAADVPTRPIPAPEEGVERPEVGRRTVNNEEWGRSYWLYVPESYNPAARYGLLVYLHPTNDTLEATVYKSWKSICDRRGIILLAPKSEALAAWTPNDAQFLADAVKAVKAEYAIDPQRVAVHGYFSSTAFATMAATATDSPFAAALLIAGPIASRVPEHDPQTRKQFYFVTGEGHTDAGKVRQSVGLLKRKGYPAALEVTEGEGTLYPEADGLKAVERWLDSLDRL